MFSQRGVSQGPQSPAHDLGRRALFASVGGGVFVFLATIGFQGKYGYLPPIAAFVVAAALIFLSLVALTNADRALAADRTLATSEPRDIRIRERYLQITRLEYVGFVVALIICNLLDQMAWLMPLVAIVSGIHYLALGRVLRSVSAWAKGAILCLAAVATIAFLPALYPPHASPAAQVYLWWIVVGFIGGAVFWFDAILCLTQGLRGRAPTQAPMR
ncbi:MAG TPA: hypothetical protein VE338_17535 [Ktedonobacterales bacterium]|jgi:hypothetical protein|nr:hypothetical protein [Ktedonobacterales bacterium]